MSYSITQHADTRMNQRGIRKEDFGLLLATADQVASDAYLMTNEIADEEIARRKKEIQQFERQRGKKLIVEGGASSSPATTQPGVTRQGLFAKGGRTHEHPADDRKFQYEPAKQRDERVGGRASPKNG